MSLNLDKTAWKRVQLGEVAVTSKEKATPDTVERYVAGEHMDTDDLKINRWGKVGEIDLGPAFHRRFRPGQVLYGSRRTYLRKVAVADFDGVCANTTFVVETKNHDVLLQEFLPFVMTTEPFHAFAIGESRGSVNPYVNWSDIARFEFNLPTIEEQKAIADLLWSLSRYTSGVASQIAATQRLLHAFIVSRGWHTEADRPLRQLASVLTEDSDLVHVEAEEQYPLVGVLNRGRGVLLREPVRGSETSYDGLNRVHAGQIIYSKLKAFEGSITVVPKHAQGRFASKEFPTFSVTDDLDGDYFRLLTSLPQFWEMLARASTGMGGRRERVKPRDFLRLELPLPPLDIQRGVVEQASEIEQTISEMLAELSALNSFKAALLAEILGGNG